MFLRRLSKKKNGKYKKDDGGVQKKRLTDQGGHLRAVGAKHLIIVARHLAAWEEKVDEEVWIYEMVAHLKIFKSWGGGDIH